MRGRAWRRHIEEKVVKKRLFNFINHSGNWWRFYNINGSKTNHPLLNDLLSTKDHFNAKTITTDNWTSKNKDKYSSNKTKGWRYSNGGDKTREWNKKYFIKILKENGLL